MSSHSSNLSHKRTHLIFGAAGFVGLALARHLSEQGESVIGVDINASTNPEFFSRFIVSPVESIDLSACGEVDYIHHLSSAVPLASDRKGFLKKNVEANKFLFQKLSPLNFTRFIYYSSSAVSGREIPSELPLSESEVFPIEEYGESKLMAERLFEAELGERLLIIRPRTIIGPGRGGLFSLLYSKISSQKTIILPGSANIPYQFIHLEDLLAAVDVLLKENAQGVFNVGGDVSLSLMNDLKELSRKNHSNSSFLELPKGLIWLLDISSRLKFIPFARWQYLAFSRPHILDVSKLRSFGWSPKFTNLRALQDGFDSRKNLKGRQQKDSVHRREVEFYGFSLFNSLRPLHWSKNLLVLLPAIFSKQVFVIDPAYLWPILSIWCLASSGVYLFNDIVDGDEDKAHPFKRLRPIANGAVSRGLAVFLSFCLITLSLLFSPEELRPYITVYYLLNLLYTLGVKRVPFLDIFFLAGFYLVRILSGFILISVPPTSWLLLGVFLFFMGLSALKREQDLQFSSLGRGYGEQSKAGLWRVGVFCWGSLLPLLVFYTMNDNATSLHARPWILLLSFFFLFLFHRRIRQKLIETKREVEFLEGVLTDSISYLCLLGVLITFLLAG